MRTPDPARSAHLLAATAAAPTYPELGATTGVLPPGYRHVDRSRPVGTGTDDFRAAAGRLMAWDVHRGAGLHVEATAPSAVLGSTVVLRARVGPLRVSAPCRVVLVVDEPGRIGFAYGTLPGHPEVGEELFVVALDDDLTVHLRITAFSRPGPWWARLGAPVARRVQDRLTDRYLTAVTAGTRPG